jgi:hypothetical protein
VVRQLIAVDRDIGAVVGIFVASADGAASANSAGANAQWMARVMCLCNWQ